MSHEPLTTQLVAEVLRDLLTAFPSKHSANNIQHTAEVYRNGLRGISGDSLRAAAEVCIKTDNFFPKIARLRELAGEWTRRNTVVSAATARGSWDVCHICGARAVERTGTAQDRDERGRLLWAGVDAEGKPIPKLHETPPRWIMDHDPRAHHVFRESEAAD